MTSTSGSASSAWATRPPQKVPSPVMRTRRPIGAHPNQTERRWRSMSYSASWICWRMASDSSMIRLRE